MVIKRNYTKPRGVQEDFSLVRMCHMENCSKMADLDAVFTKP